jgi:hypothetical protein
MRPLAFFEHIDGRPEAGFFEGLEFREMTSPPVP